MITHENTDISIATVSLLQEMTDVDISTEEEKESLLRFVDAFIAGQGLELIVQNITRLGGNLSLTLFSYSFLN